MTNPSLIDIPSGVSLSNFNEVVAVTTALLSRPDYRNKIPTVADVKSMTTVPVKDCARIYFSKQFASLMAARGYPIRPNAQGLLTAQQVMTVQILTDPTIRKPMKDKLAMAGITYATYRAWLKQPVFSEYITSIGEQMITEHVADVHTKVVERAASGDIQAMRLYYELTGRNDPATKQIQDLQTVISRILEVITRNISDTVVLSRIASEINTVMSGPAKIDAIAATDLERINPDYSTDVQTITSVPAVGEETPSEVGDILAKLEAIAIKANAAKADSTFNL